MPTLRFELLVVGVVLCGMVQYGPAAVHALLSGQVSLWTMDADMMQESTPLRYIKDGFLFAMSAYWPLSTHWRSHDAVIRHITGFYFCWLALVVTAGVAAYIFEYSPLFFLPSGLRWVMLLHASLGLFLLGTVYQPQPKSDFALGLCLAALLGADALLVVRQLSSVGALFGMGLAQARLTGFFSNAGVAGMFALGVALIASQLRFLRFGLKLTNMLLALFIAMGSGTRFAMMSIAIAILAVVYEQIQLKAGQLKPAGVLLLVSFGLLLLPYGYVHMLEAVGRGDLFASQFSKGGRATTFMTTLNLLLSSEPGEFLLGRGFGIGTNTAFGQLEAADVNPWRYRYNLLMDNAFLTAFFQLGLVGSLLFWGGIAAFLRAVRPKREATAKRSYFLLVTIMAVTCMAGNPFEQYYLMMAFLICLGLIYGRDRQHFPMAIAAAPEPVPQRAFSQDPLTRDFV